MKAKLSFLLFCVVALVASPAKATIYNVLDQSFKTQCNTFPACPITGSLTGTITTDGTVGVGLSPSIITGWNFFLNDGTNPVVNLITANSFITYNFSNLLSATPSELDFNFSADANFQPLMEFTSSSNSSVLVEIFSSILYTNQETSQAGVGIWTGSVGHPDVGLLVAYLS